MSTGGSMKVTVDDGVVNISDDEITVILNVKLTKDELVKVDYNRSLSRDVIECVQRRLIDEVSQLAVEKYTDEILKAIDLEAIVRRVQLQVINNIKA